METESRNQWLVEVIPAEWADKDALIEIVLFRILTHYVEVEKGCEHNTPAHFAEDLAAGHIDQEYVDRHLVVVNDLLKAYKYITIDRPLLDEQLSESYPDHIPAFDQSIGSLSEYDKTYGETNRLKKLIEESDTWVFNTIIKHRGSMWT